VLNPVDTEAAEARAAAAAGEEAPAPRSGEYQVSETPPEEPQPPAAGNPAADPQTAAP
jgi:hypothetical protein